MHIWWLSCRAGQARLKGKKLKKKKKERCPGCLCSTLPCCWRGLLCHCPHPLPAWSLRDAQGQWLQCFSCISSSVATTLCKPSKPRGASLHPKAHRSRMQAGFAEEPAIPRSPSSTCSSGKWPSAAVRVPELCLRPDFHAFNGAALQAGTRPEGFLFLSSSLLEAFPSSPDLPLPGGPPSALGSDRYYGRAEKGRTETPPECRERFLELP